MEVTADKVLGCTHNLRFLFFFIITQFLPPFQFVIVVMEYNTVTDGSQEEGPPLKGESALRWFPSVVQVAFSSNGCVGRGDRTRRIRR